jgi:hypothetical protein
MYTLPDDPTRTETCRSFQRFDVIELRKYKVYAFVC